MSRRDVRLLPPFTVVHRRMNASSGGDFTPSAEVAFCSKEAISDLIRTIGASDFRLLIAVLTLVTPNGRIFATPKRVGQVTGESTLRVYLHLLRLCHIKWRGTALLMKLDHEGITMYMPSLELLGERIGPLELDDPPEPPRAASREDVIEASRRQYATPRAKAEEEIAIAHGWPMEREEEIKQPYEAEVTPELTGGDARLRNRLMRYGVERFAADSLVRTYGRDRCNRQLAYLWYRQSTKSKSKAGLLVASIVGDYEAPPLQGAKGNH